MRAPRARAAARLTTTVVALVALGACSGQGAADQVDLDATASPTSAATATTEPSATGGTTPAEPEPDRAPTIITPQGLTAEQRGAVDAYTAYVVAVDRLARTNDLEGSGVLDVTTGLIQDGVRGYTEESLQVGRTSAGPPLQVRIDAVEVQAAAATMPVCFDQSSWVDVVGGVPTPVPPLLAFDVALTRQGDRWLVSSVADADLARCIS